MKKIFIASTVLSTLILSGCNGFNKFTKNAQAPYTINHILISSEIDSTNKPVDLLEVQRQVYLDSYKQALKAEHPNLELDFLKKESRDITTKIEAITEASQTESIKGEANKKMFLNGTQYAQLLCGKYMQELDASIANRRYASQQVDIVGGAISAALGIADVSSKVVGGSALGFSSLNSSMKAYENAYVLSPDIEQVETLVREKMYEIKMKYYKDVKNVKTLKNFDSIYEVMEALDEYSHQCSPTGMKALIKTAINEKIVKTNEDANKTDLAKAQAEEAEADTKAKAAQAKAKDEAEKAKN